MKLIYVIYSHGCFMNGFNSTMIGNYLTTKGRKVEDDLQMIKDLKLELEVL